MQDGCLSDEDALDYVPRNKRGRPEVVDLVSDDEEGDEPAAKEPRLDTESAADAVQAASQEADTLYSRGMVSRSKKRMPSACASFEKAVELGFLANRDPHWLAEALERLAETELLRGKAHEAAARSALTRAAGLLASADELRCKDVLERLVRLGPDGEAAAGQVAREHLPHESPAFLWLVAQRTRRLRAAAARSARRLELDRSRYWNQKASADLAEQREQLFASVSELAAAARLSPSAKTRDDTLANAAWALASRVDDFPPPPPRVLPARAGHVPVTDRQGALEAALCLYAEALAGQASRVGPQDTAAVMTAVALGDVASDDPRFTDVFKQAAAVAESLHRSGEPCELHEWWGHNFPLDGAAALLNNYAGAVEHMREFQRAQDARLVQERQRLDAETAALLAARARRPAGPE